MNITRFSTLVAIVVLAAMARFIPHPFNFTPIAAIALFGGAYFTKRWQALFVPMAAMLGFSFGYGYCLCYLYISFGCGHGNA